MSLIGYGLSREAPLSLAEQIARARVVTPLTVKPQAPRKAKPARPPRESAPSAVERVSAALADGVAHTTGELRKLTGLSASAVCIALQDLDNLSAVRKVGHRGRNGLWRRV